MITHHISTKTFGDEKTTTRGARGGFLPSKEINLLEFWQFCRFLELYLKNSAYRVFCGYPYKHLLSFGGIYMIAQFLSFFKIK